MMVGNACVIVSSVSMKARAVPHSLFILMTTEFPTPTRELEYDWAGNKREPKKPHEYPKSKTPGRSPYHRPSCGRWCCTPPFKAPRFADESDERCVDLFVAVQAARARAADEAERARRAEAAAQRRHDVAMSPRRKPKA